MDPIQKLSLLYYSLDKHGKSFVAGGTETSRLHKLFLKTRGDREHSYYFEKSLKGITYYRRDAPKSE